MLSALLRGISLFGSLLGHRQRRFLLDRLHLGILMSSLAQGRYQEIRLPNGLRLSINPLLHGHLAKDGYLAYEPAVIEALERHLSKGAIFYDVGANVGAFSFLAATLVGDGGHVLAFEPEPNNTSCFRRSAVAARLLNLKLHDCALGAADGETVFDRHGGAFSGRLIEQRGGAPKERVLPVKVRSIDSLLAEGAPPPTLLKIDVEGGEGAVLEGAAEALRRHRPVVLCEMHPDNPDGVRRAFEALKAAGYRLSALEEPTQTVSGPRATDSTYHVLAIAA